MYYDGYGNPAEVIGEQELAEKYGEDPHAFLRAVEGSERGAAGGGGKGYVSLVVFDSEEERHEYLESIGEQISGFGGCRSQCQ